MGLFGLFGKKTLYYPGCLTRGVLSTELENYKEIFNRLGIDFVMLPMDEVCCGLPVLNAGYRKDARKLANKNFDLFKKNRIKKIITNCPSCYHTFKEIYPEFVKGWDIEVEHATVAILNALKKKNIKWRGEDRERELVAYHDPCHLGRYSGIYEEPREVIERLGGKVFEFELNRKDAICCGAGGGMRANFPSVAKMVVKKKVSEIPDWVNGVISPCGLCYANIKSATEKSIEFSDFVLRKLKEMR
ncbi:MAG: (Fe-S)-binding protein [archaeon]